MIVHSQCAAILTMHSGNTRHEYGFDTLNESAEPNSCSNCLCLRARKIWSVRLWVARRLTVMPSTFMFRTVSVDLAGIHWQC